MVASLVPPGRDGSRPRVQDRDEREAGPPTCAAVTASNRPSGLKRAGGDAVGEVLDVRHPRGAAQPTGNRRSPEPSQPAAVEDGETTGRRTRPVAAVDTPTAGARGRPLNAFNQNRVGRVDTKSRVRYVLAFVRRISMTEKEGLINTLSSRNSDRNDPTFPRPPGDPLELSPTASAGKVRRRRHHHPHHPENPPEERL